MDKTFVVTAAPLDNGWPAAPYAHTCIHGLAMYIWLHTDKNGGVARVGEMDSYIVETITRGYHVYMEI